MTDERFKLVLLTQFAATLFMVGVIWFVQLVHYPLFDSVGRTDFPHYEELHRSLISWIVAPAMLIEGFTAIVAIRFRHRSTSEWTGVALLGIIWCSTAFIQIPCHNELSHAYDVETHRNLVLSNWIRTVSWSLRGAILFRTVWKSMT